MRREVRFLPSVLPGTVLLAFRSMTALNIRKNIASGLRLVAESVEQAKVPTLKEIKNKTYEYRIRAAAVLIPKDAVIVITPDKN